MKHLNLPIRVAAIVIKTRGIVAVFWRFYFDAILVLQSNLIFLPSFSPFPFLCLLVIFPLPLTLSFRVLSSAGTLLCSELRTALIQRNKDRLKVANHWISIPLSGVNKNRKAQVFLPSDRPPDGSCSDLPFGPCICVAAP